MTTWQSSKCPTCGKSWPEGSDRCPHCHSGIDIEVKVETNDFRDRFTKSKLVGGIACLALLLLVFLARKLALNS
jgi:hypothetical protein